MQSMWLCNFLCRRFEDAFEHALWRKAKQMQPMRLCILSGKPFKNAQWRKVKKCNQCDFASSRADNLRTHLKTHSWEKPNKYNQCDYASSQASNLRTHLKTHSGEKLNNCDQCDFACWLRTQNCWENYTIFRGNVAKQLLDWLRKTPS